MPEPCQCEYAKNFFIRIYRNCRYAEAHYNIIRTKIQPAHKMRTEPDSFAVVIYLFFNTVTAAPAMRTAAAIPAAAPVTGLPSVLSEA